MTSAYSTDTIAAIATPPGRGGIGIIRLSGKQAKAIGLSISRETHLLPRQANFSRYEDADGEIIDEGLTLFFPGPHSFTGEDVVELQAHGSPIALDRLLQRLIQLGARLANPGEFSERAFLNNKIDLTQAEAIADLIDANTQAAAKAAVNSLQGAFSAAIAQVNQSIIALRLYVEAAIDFPDEEDVDFISEGAVVEKLTTLHQQLDAIEQQAHQGQLLRDGMTIVLAGLPNAGKSSLLNQLVGDERAIVTDIAGTTRDVLREVIAVDGMPVTIIDTAGLRESDDVVEAEGIRRAQVAIEQADHVLYLVDSGKGITADDHEQLRRLAQYSEPTNRTLLWNKQDNLAQSHDVPGSNGTVETIAAHALRLSAKTGQGVDALREHLKSLAGFRESDGGQFLARRRHLAAIELAQTHVQIAETVLRETNAGELAAEELRLAHQALGEITGEFTADDLLGVIFSQFCIGK